MLTESVNLKEKSVDGSESEVSTMLASNACFMSLLIPQRVSSHFGLAVTMGWAELMAGCPL